MRLSKHHSSANFPAARAVAPLLAALAWAAFLPACGSKPPPAAPKLDAEPVEEPVDEGPATPEEIETGSDCATAKGLCEGGVCTVDVNNGCEAAVSCQLEAMALCRDGNATGEARGKGRDTIAAGESSQIQAQGDCEGRQTLATQLVNLSCK